MYHIFQHWIKKNKINFPHRHQTYGYEWSISVEGWQPSWYGVSFCFRNTNKSFLARRRHFPNDMESVSASETPTNLSSLEADIFQTIWSQSFRFRNTNKSFLAGRRYFPHDNWQLGGSDIMWLTRCLISCYQSFAPISAHGLISLWHFRCLRMS